MTRRTVLIGVGAVLLLAVIVIAALTLLGPVLSPPLACTLIGCWDGFSITFTGDVPSDYTAEVTGSDGAHFSTTCHLENGSALGEGCLPDGGVAVRMTAPDVTVTVRWDGGSKTQVFHQSYHTVQPNGPNCSPTCQRGETLTMSLP